MLLFVGSGSLAAMATFEDRYKPNMEVCAMPWYLYYFHLSG